jgi:hypothetical protein
MAWWGTAALPVEFVWPLGQLARFQPPSKRERKATILPRLGFHSVPGLLPFGVSADRASGHPAEAPSLGGARRGASSLAGGLGPTLLFSQLSFPICQMGYGAGGTFCGMHEIGAGDAENDPDQAGNTLAVKPMKCNDGGPVGARRAERRPGSSPGRASSFPPFPARPVREARACGAAPPAPRGPPPPGP